MIYKLTDKIWWGDKPSIEEARGKVKSVINVAHSIKSPYWKNVGRLDWDVWYFRLALPDAEPVTEEYMTAFHRVAKSISYAEKFPLLCHCRMGGHRGPTAALMAHWVITATPLKECIDLVLKHKPRYMRPNSRRVYRDTTISFLQKLEIAGDHCYPDY